MATRKSPPKASPAADSDDAQPDFETALKELESVVGTLEKGEAGLDESLKQFERGVKLTRVCQEALRDAEQKVETLLKNGDVKPYSPEE